MNKNFQKIEKDLRSIAKRYKSVKYSIGLVILFLMMGLNAFSEEVNTSTKTNVNNPVETVATREGIKDSVEGLQGKIRDARAENVKSIELLRLELIQLMEQGNQVVKSPWSSWQFGIKYTYDNWSGTYKGRGDKPPKYVYENIYRRGNWEERNAIDTIAGKTVDGAPITPGNENTSTWQTATTSSGVVKLKRDTSIDASTNGKREWGLVELRKIREPLNEVEIFANVSPKEVKKDKLDIPVSVTPPATLSAPVVKPNVNKPTEAPKVDLPDPPVLEIPGDPNLSFNPTISVLKVEKVGTITVNPPSVTPVDFALTAGGMPGSATTFGTYYGNKHNQTSYKGTLDGTETTHSTHNVTANNYIATWNVQSKETTFKYLDVNVTIANTRAFMVDEGRFAGGDKFIFDGGIIKLKNSKNVGIDVQGTHGGSKESIYQMSVYNQGTIIGEGNSNTEHAGISFNNFDASDDYTRVFLSNEGKGTITMNAPTSAAMMLRPEINFDKYKNDGGVNMQFAQNTSSITLNARNNVGITVVKNPNNTGYNKTKFGITVPVGGLLASRSDNENVSGVLNTGKIEVFGDDSAGVSILNGIQEVKVNGTINIGVGTISTDSKTKDGASDTLANRASGGTVGKVEGSVGVYTEEATRPVRGREYTYDTDGNATLVTSYYDDHGRENTKETTSTFTNSKGETKTKHTGVTIGTETVEVAGTVTLGANSTDSFGLRNKASGSITLVSGGTVVVEGEKNYGALSKGEVYQRQVRTVAGKDYTGVQEIAKIDINSGAKITVTGKKSIGYAMLSGEGTNAGTIEVTGNNSPAAGSTTYEGSLGFYGENGKFINRGLIDTKGVLAHSVVVKNTGMTFNHEGTVKVDSPNTAKGNIAVYSDGNATVNFYNNSNVFVGANSVGIYSADEAKFNTTFKNHGNVNIKIGADSTFAYLDGAATTTLKEFFNLNPAKVTIIENMGANSSLVYANNQANALLDADLTIDKGDAAASTIALLATNKSSVTVDTGKKLTTNTQVALAAVNATTTAGNGSKAENKGAIVSNRTNDGIGIYAKDGGSEAINDGTITMMGKKAAGMYGEDITTFENKAGKSVEVQEEESVGMYAKVTGTNTLTAQNNGKIITNKQKSVGIYLKNDTTGPVIAKLTASNNEIEIKGGTESIGIYAPASTVSKVGKITMADGVKKSIGVYLSKGAQATTVATDEVNLGLSGKNIAYYIKNENTGF